MKPVLLSLPGLQRDLRLTNCGFSGIAVLCYCLFFAFASPTLSQGTSVFTTIDVTGAGKGTLQGTAITAIDASGDVTGTYIDSNNALHGFVLPAGGAISTFDVTGAGTSAIQGTIPTGINASGVIAGTYIDGNVASHGFVRAANGTITTFDAPSASSAANRGTVAMRINDSGVITGFYTTGSYDTNSTYHGFQRAANGTITNIDAPNAGSGEGTNGRKQGTSAYSINASGVIVGSYLDSSTKKHGFVFSSGGTFAEFDPTGVGTCVDQNGGNFGGTSVATIDAAGDAAGTFTDTNCAQHGFMRAANGTITNFDAPGASLSPCANHGFGKVFCGTFGAELDAAGDMTGGYADSEGILHGFVRPSATGIITSFDDPSAGSTGSMQGTMGTAISSTGAGIEIAGVYADTNSVLHGFLYIPVLTATTTALTSAPSPNPSIYGEPVTLTATVSSSKGAPPNGENVSFLSGTALLGTAQLSNGTASTTTTTLPTGADSITAVYGGDSNFAGSTSTAIIQTVGKASSTTTLNSSPNPSSFQQLVTFTAGVSGQFGGIATGSVTFRIGGTSLGTASLSGGSAKFTFTALPQSSDSITAVYNGDSNFSGSSSNTVSQVVVAEVLDDWTWLGGSSMVGSNGGQAGVYGILGTPAAANIPGSRQIGATWTDSGGKLWLFGGWGYDSTGIRTLALNDLWELNPSTNLWTWMGGSSTVGVDLGQPGVYGNLGSPAAGNIPGSRNAASRWTDSSGNLWLFGGNGYDVVPNYSVLNDLWKFNPSTNQWAWMSGSEYVGQSGVYGALGTPSSSTVPGSRYGASSWIDSSGNLWLFGGLGKDSAGTTNWLNDVWEFNPSTSQWTWMGGSSMIGSSCGAYGCGRPGVYGTLGTPAASNIPGSRKFATSWTDRGGNFWLFGGFGNDANDAEGWLNDLWKLNPSTNQWAWMGGSSTVGNNGGQPGVYGAPGTPVPGGRQLGASWTDGNGNLWLFGGEGLDGNGSYGFMNDLWEFNPSTNQWAWIGGSSTGDKSGVYGELAVPASGSVPGGRGYTNAWTDNYGNFWLFGGNGYDAGGNQGDLGDLWKYQPTAVTSPNATLSATSLSFGSENLGSTSASQSATLTNKSSVSLSITSISLTGANASSFVFANSCGSSLAAGASCTIHGHFTPAAAGALTAAINIIDSATGSPQSIALSGTGVNSTTVTLSATSLSFGPRNVSTTSASQSVTLTNTGSSTLAITSISLTGADASSFLFANSCGSSLAAGGTCSIHGHFTPTTTGALTAAITVVDSATGSPQSIALSGTGTNATTVSLSATSLSYGFQDLGTTSASQSVTLTNTGSATLAIASIGVTGTDASSFVFANSCGSSLAASASCTIHGHFTPAAAGALTAAINIIDSATGSPQSIALSGTGVNSTTVTLSATSLSFGPQNVGTTSASQSVTLTNTGSSILVITSIGVTGANASSFLFANSCGSSLTVGANCTIHGHFTPTTTGALTAAITIVDSATGSPQSIALSGTGQ